MLNEFIFKTCYIIEVSWSLAATASLICYSLLIFRYIEIHKDVIIFTNNLFPPTLRI